jgi:hypothetical protein
VGHRYVREPGLGAAPQRSPQFRDGLFLISNGSLRRSVEGLFARAVCSEIVACTHEPPEGRYTVPVFAVLVDPALVTRPVARAFPRAR